MSQSNIYYRGDVSDNIPKLEVDANIYDRSNISELYDTGNTDQSYNRQSQVRDRSDTRWARGDRYADRDEDRGNSRRNLTGHYDDRDEERDSRRDVSDPREKGRENDWNWKKSGDRDQRRDHGRRDVDQAGYESHDNDSHHKSFLSNFLPTQAYQSWMNNKLAGYFTNEDISDINCALTGYAMKFAAIGLGLTLLPSVMRPFYVNPAPFANSTILSDDITAFQANGISLLFVAVIVYLCRAYSCDTTFKTKFLGLLMFHSLGNTVFRLNSFIHDSIPAYHNVLLLVLNAFFLVKTYHTLCASYGKRSKWRSGSSGSQSCSSSTCCDEVQQKKSRDHDTTGRFDEARRRFEPQSSQSGVHSSSPRMQDVDFSK